MLRDLDVPSGTEHSLHRLSDSHTEASEERREVWVREKRETRAGRLPYVRPQASQPLGSGGT